MKYLYFLLLFATIKADLCTKCYRADTEGTWFFHLSSDTYEPNVFNSRIHCGHEQPNSPNSPEQIQLRRPREVQVTFSSPNNFHIDDYFEDGWWTMLYNIGFWARTPGYEFFGFFGYRHRKNSDEFYDCVSHCDRIVGSWYTDRSTGRIGCFYGKKVKLFEEELELESSRKAEDVYDELDKIKYEDLAFLVDKINSQTEKLWTATLNEEFIGKTLDNLWGLIRRRPVKKDLSVPSLQSIINYLKAPQSFAADKSLYYYKDFAESLRKTGIYVDTSDPVLQYWYTHVDDIPDSALPRNWDWRNISGISYMSPVRSQGKCGSCYILGSLNVIESRVRIATKNAIKPKLSPQQILSCSFYSEGCKGGEAMSVGKFGMDFSYISDDCFPYKETEKKCEYSCWDGGKAKIGAAFAAYVGDYKESPEMNEARIMKEVRARGPVTVGIISPFMLRYYKSGIIACDSTLLPSSNLSESETEIFKRIREGFRPVEHLVVVAGWGETDKGEKYWVVQNTWGEKYGDKGYFLLKRGANECAIETDAVALYPKISR
eukprot:TRINITY_DN10583_c0_g3_i1.p1 TRINITY_DN10583_c0_g3~~TRINITY_DN10583_c0_g3_i1.p1  ORF type:complete len:544 (-),score=121.28 TRINITY_DN10583_c0_g3_i1:145-1776(-)